MGDQRIAMHERDVLLRLADGSRIEGKVFLGLYEAHRNGPQRLGDLLNGEGCFFPVRSADEVILVNLAQIVSAATVADGEADDLMRLGEKYRIRVTTLGREEIAADIFVNLPSTHQRVKDALNLSGRFLPLFSGDSILYLNTEFILYVKD